MQGKRLEEILCMKGGDGEVSYNRNCSSQAALFESVIKMVEESIVQMKIPNCQTFCVADLGCSSAQNSILAVETILQAAKGKYLMDSVPLPEFCVYFNDLQSNDFNSLFRRLPALGFTGNMGTEESIRESKLKGNSYFSAGVPGSFHKRLFPKNSLHFVHSSCSLHWLSQIPEAIEDKTAETYNKWETFIAREGPCVIAQAYLEQFKSDMNAFLRARSEEVIEGGCMFLNFPCRVSSDPREQGSMLSSCGQLLGAAFRDLIREGLIDEEKLHSFNLPLFSPTAEEFKMMVKAEGSFRLQRCEVLGGGTAGYVAGNRQILMKDRDLLGTELSKQYRTALESIIECKIGGELTDKLFERVAKRAAEKSEECISHMERLNQLVAVLVRENRAAKNDRNF